jgi:hypothetical protein
MKNKKPFPGKGKPFTEGRDVVNVSKREFKVKSEANRRAKENFEKEALKKKRFYNDIYKS